MKASIAGKLNRNFLWRELFHFLVLDILLCAFLAAGFLIFLEDYLADGKWIERRYLAEWRDGHYQEISITDITDILDSDTLYYVLQTEDDEEIAGDISRYLSFVQTPLFVLWTVQAFFLITGLFHTRKIRKILKPLHQMAKKAEELSAMAAFQSQRFVRLEQEISDIRPDKPDAKIHTTGDKELQSLEIAINNLLQRMRETYQQQNRFVSDASHELRTPIAVIEGYVNMLDRWGKTDESILEESIEALKNESAHMKRLVEQLLFLARGDSGRNHLNIEEILFTDMVREVYEEFQMIDEKHHYRFSAKEGIVFQGDMAMLKQSLRIFTDNAAKYSKEGTEILLSVKETEQEVFYIVEDEGMGMSQSEAEHIFERFYRSDQARNSKTGGTGLGLSIAYWIIDAHKGQVEILSRQEFGTRFTVRFPKK